MADERPPEVMTALPHTRPHRRSDKRAPRPAADAAAATAPRRPVQSAGAASTHRAGRLRQPAQPGGTPPGPRSRGPFPATRGDIAGTAMQAAAELAEIGLSVSARALRNAVARLPRP